MRRFAAAFVGLALLAGMAQAAEPGVTLGILEESPALYAHSATFFKVRLAFIRRGDGWGAVCTRDFCPPDTAPRAAAWSVGFSGKYLSSIPGPPRPPQREWSLNARGVPTVGRPSEEFGGFLDSTVHRPLVVSSARRFADPDGWARRAPPEKITAALRSEFRKRFPVVENCRSSRDEGGAPWAYRDANIRVPKFYASRNGWSVAAVKLAPYRCDGPEDDAFAQQWFAISPEGVIKYLDEGIWLLDAGDYDGDGKSELIFTIDRYNEGGYVLYYDGFKRHTTVEFHYH